MIPSGVRGKGIGVVVKEEERGEQRSLKQSRVQ